MAAPRSLRNPPITEALVDIRIAHVAGVSAATLAPLRDELAAEYPEVEERRKAEAKLAVTPQGIETSTQDLGFAGLFVKTQDGRLIAQFRDDGFTLNMLRPYSGGDDLIGRALSLWSRYVEFTKPRAVVRLALRFINHLDLPYERGDDIRKFLPAAPFIPDELPQAVSDFLVRSAVHDDQTGISAILIEKLALAPQGATTMPVILDIDTFIAKQLPTTGAALRPRLEALREFKNRAFFALLTEEAIGLYE